MAKSTRSKVKRHFRAKKRTEGVYAAAEAARLNRLHQKLKTLTTRDKDGDVEIPEEAVESFSDEEGAQQPGWYWFANIGLLDPADVTAEGMQIMEHLVRRIAPAAASGSDALKQRIWRGGFESPSSNADEEDGSGLFDGQPIIDDSAQGADTMAVDPSNAGPSTEGTKRISTHGPRGSRREEWRLSKGMPARAQSKGMNRQGTVAAKRKSGRSHRRR